ncbi:hypothetical protein PIB30_054574 [Stylosanthes scabra]|uniref:Uncharacterized protein n=1 Tax=Stylosanthes scabra TaxID=79078 RepID=A0ABU6UHL7_9FABA|nr:hypothetical protein [Stylosanthes scabra]
MAKSVCQESHGSSHQHVSDYYGGEKISFSFMVEGKDGGVDLDDASLLQMRTKDVFKEEAALPDDDDVIFLNPEEEWPSHDPEDDDCNPDRRHYSHNINAEVIDDNPFDSSGVTSQFSTPSTAPTIEMPHFLT